MRLTFPRRVYTAARREQIHGLRIVYQAPTLRHFTARFEPVRP